VFSCVNLPLDSLRTKFVPDKKFGIPVAPLVQLSRVNDCPPPWRMTSVAWGEDMQPHWRGSVGGFPPHSFFF